MTYEELVAKLQDSYGEHDASKIKEHVAIQFNVRGEADGALYLEILDGKIYVQPYEYHDRDILVTISAENLIAIAEDKLDVVDAYNKGILSAEGDLGKALLLKDIVRKKDEGTKKTVTEKVSSTVSLGKAVAKAATTAATNAVKNAAAAKNETATAASEEKDDTAAATATSKKTTGKRCKGKRK